MKTNSNIWVAISALIIGLLLIIFANATTLFSTMVIAIGILIILPCVITFISAVTPHKRADGSLSSRNASLAILAGLGTALGVVMVCVPGVFAAAIIYLLGGLLILAGVAGIIYLMSASRERDIPSWLYAVPALTIIAGIVIIILGGPKLADHIAAIIAGVMMIAYGANEIWASITGRKSKRIDSVKSEE